MIQKNYPRIIIKNPIFVSAYGNIVIIHFYITDRRLQDEYGEDREGM